MNKDSDHSRKNWEKGQELIHQVLSGERPNTDLARLASGACSVHARMVASEANMETNRLMLTKLIYEDPKAREEYIKKSAPQLMEDKK